MSLKHNWWCIKCDCNHYSNDHCKHNSAVNSKKCTTPELGRVINTMIMCPVLYDMREED